MVGAGDTVYLQPDTQRALYLKGYEHALSPWRVTAVNASGVQLVPHAHKKQSFSCLVVPLHFLVVGGR
jgi:hypothetical protein